MTDIVEVFEGYCESLNWKFSYGDAANINLLDSDGLTDSIHFLLDPVTRLKIKSEYGGDTSQSFTGRFMLLVNSDYDNVYHTQRDTLAEEGKYEKNIKPLLVYDLQKFEDLIDCSDYTINNWEVVDAVDVLDANLDGVIVTYKLTIVD